MRRKDKKSVALEREFTVPGGTISAWIALVFMAFVVVLLALSAETRVALYAGAGWLVLLGLAYKFLVRTPQDELASSK